MKSGPELVDAANLSLVGSYRTLVGHCPGGEIREVDGVFAFATGLPLSVFNGCIAVGPTSASEFEAALAWIGERGLPYRVWIDEERAPDLSGVALARGLDPDPVPYPGMVLHPVPNAPAPSPGVTVIPVTRADLPEHLGVRVESGIPLDLARRLFPPSFAADPDVQLFTARLDGRPVGGAVAIRSGDVSGVYAVGTLPAARRRGVGTAATWAAATAGRAWGCDTVVPYATFKSAVPQR